MIQLQIIVSGEVQGVGYRYYTQMKAIQFGITGWVRNLREGGVEILASGAKVDLEKFIDEVRRGNPFSTVDHIEVNEIENTETYKSFAIKY
ncbi:acylphosphatase [Mesobacillus sp. AQ2]|uniref:acylphosphatase n=1 Tax=Bacillaceae TaxID=186817 RepID=UPI00119E8E46|nr:MULTISPECIES: acylphosphatase [Bacillaceae]MCM3125442.1 acylphosphatase [Mesobacillus sp. MER 33]MCM3234514.1 acylphosphatase [Mesobacillus sp. MER 48]WHX41486.1 acylphosphatase [Mesobacillus sp. AQ2]